MEAKTEKKGNIIDAFVGGARNGFKIGTNSMVPNIIFGFYGMNVQLPFPFVWFPSFVAILACVVATVYFFRHNMFK